MTSVTPFPKRAAPSLSTPTEALVYFDGLDTVAISDMIGSWRGESFPTAHPLDGVLETYHWYGKRFESAEHVHPLVFETLNGRPVSINPLWALPVVRWLYALPWPKSKTVGRLFQACIGLVSTHHSSARLRLTVYRDRATATMVYDTLPINDIFRKIDNDTLLGLMDLKGANPPFFFLLHREPSQD